MKIAVIKNADFGEIVHKKLEKYFEKADNDFVNIAKTQANDFMNKMKLAVPVDKGNLKQSIDIAPSKKSNKFFWVGPKYAGKNNLFVGGNHAHLVEYGTKERYMKQGLFAGGYTRVSGGGSQFKGKPNYAPKAGKNTGIMTAKAFVRPTVDSYGKNITDAMEKQILDVIKKTKLD